MRLIDADALKEHICNMCDDGQRECKGDESCALLVWVNDMPTIEDEPVLHGRWIETKYIPVGDTMYCVCNCYNCNFEITIEKGRYPKFCENCGAKMDGGAENG